MTPITTDKLPLLSSRLLNGRTLLVRADYNISTHNAHEAVNQLRLKKSIPTLSRLLPKNKIILLSHMGRPDKPDDSYSLSHLISPLTALLPGIQITLARTIDEARAHVARMSAGEILLLENLRFFSGEKDGDVEFAKDLALLGDGYVNDAFAVSHRSDASITGLPALLPHAAGLLMEYEIEHLSGVILSPHRPLLAIVGGAKIAEKITYLTTLFNHCDDVYITGAIANTLLAAMGHPMHDSLIEREALSLASQLIDNASTFHARIHLPTDLMVLNSVTHDIRTSAVSDVKLSESACDIGPDSLASLASAISTSGTILWNGPAGLTSDPRCILGTRAIFRSISEAVDTHAIIGGGDTLSAISHSSTPPHIYLSTGGGAMLSFIEKGTLPGIDALIPPPHL